MTTIRPLFSEFQRLARAYNVIPLFQDIVVDRMTPVSVYERLSQNEPYAFLLESVEGGERFGRYSFVGRRPHAIFVCQNDQVLYREGKRQKSWKTANPLSDLKRIFQQFKAAELPGLPRFWGGAVGYWDYDTVRFFERLPNGKPDTLGVPQGAFQLSGELMVFDRFSQTAKVIANIFIPPGRPSSRALARIYREGIKTIKQQVNLINDRKFFVKSERLQPSSAPHPFTKRKAFIQAVRKAKNYIRAGDIIQVVLSQRWLLRPNASPFQIYRALRLVNPSPYMYCLHLDDVDIVGSSPELLVRKEGVTAETRPIAGTRPRGKTPQEDLVLAEELKKDPKERAEHLMLVDLGRNDLGRVCQPGSVRVPEFMVVENYSHVMHLVSSVTGTLSPQANAFDLFQACFPAGTVAGAPKIRAMQIIDELETMRRGPYAGALGYFSYNGNMDMAITIRTLVFKGGKALLQAGAGIVADSIPAKEYRECEQKAAALLAAVQKAKELQ